MAAIARALTTAGPGKLGTPASQSCLRCVSARPGLQSVVGEADVEMLLTCGLQRAQAQLQGLGGGRQCTSTSSAVSCALLNTSNPALAPCLHAFLTCASERSGPRCTDRGLCARAFVYACARVLARACVKCVHGTCIMCVHGIVYVSVIMSVWQCTWYTCARGCLWVCGIVAV